MLECSGSEKPHHIQNIQRITLTGSRTLRQWVCDRCSIVYMYTGTRVRTMSTCIYVLVPFGQGPELSDSGELWGEHGLASELCLAGRWNPGDHWWVRGARRECMTSTFSRHPTLLENSQERSCVDIFQGFPQLASPSEIPEEWGCASCMPVWVRACNQAGRSQPYTLCMWCQTYLYGEQPLLWKYLT